MEQRLGALCNISSQGKNEKVLEAGPRVYILSRRIKSAQKPRNFLITNTNSLHTTNTLQQPTHNTNCIPRCRFQKLFSSSSRSSRGPSWPRIMAAAILMRVKCIALANTTETSNNASRANGGFTRVPRAVSDWTFLW
jgi:hypothetical protein